MASPALAPRPPNPANPDATAQPAQPVQPAQPAEAAEAAEEERGSIIGRYTLLEKLGEGGFGVVYMAEQREPVRRCVALKIIKAGMDTREVVARFEAERQALALMDHPNIARILDGGVVGGGSTESQIPNPKSQIQRGRPYFVMELVRGLRITDFCDQRQLGLKERLELFVQVCQAVQHAHQKGIIHRDLKPSNILVALDNPASPVVPKVIDFGIAKATQQELTEKTLFTAYGQFLGTPAYMSPEQAVMTNLDIDTRTDIYSLGVLLYELLTGQLPFDTRELMKVGFDELCRTLREIEPPRPSTRLSTLAGDALAGIARSRRTDAPRLLHHVRGDLDWIVMKCLEKDRARRYETANALVRDLERHLNQEPIAARPPSASYRFQKFVGRNRLAVGAATTLLVTLLAGLGFSLWQYADKSSALVRAVAAEQEQSRLRQSAQTEATRSRQVARLLQDTLGSVDPARARGRDTTLLREVLDRAAERIATDLPDQPVVAAELRTTLGRVYTALAEYPKAEAMNREALKLTRAAFGTQHVEVARSLNRLGWTLAQAGQLAEAEQVLRDALAMNLTLNGPEDIDTARVRNSLGFTLVRQDRYAEAEALLRQALATLKLRVGPTHSDVGGASIAFAETLARLRKYAEAEAVAREALAILKPVHGPVHPHVANALASLGYALSRQGKPADAEPVLREALAAERTLYGNKHPSVANSLEYLAQALADQEKFLEAEALFREVLALKKELYGPEHSEVADTLNDLGWHLAYQDRFADAEQLFRDALAMKQKALGREHVDVATVLQSLGSTLSVQGRYAEADQAFRDALAMRIKLLGPEHSDVSDAYHNLAMSLKDQGRAAEAEAAFRACLDIRRKQPGFVHPITAKALHHLALTLTQQGRDAEAEPLLREAFALRKQVEGLLHRHTTESFDELAKLLARQRKHAEAQAWLQAELAEARASTPPAPAAVERALSALSENLTAQGKFSNAVASRREMLELHRRRYPANHEKVLDASSDLACCLTDWAWGEHSAQSAAAGQHARQPETAAHAREAERLLRECFALRDGRTNLSRAVLGDTRSRLGAAVLAVAVTEPASDVPPIASRFREAEQLLLAGQTLIQRSTSSTDGQKRAALERLVRLYTAWEESAPSTAQAGKAALWKEKLASLDNSAAHPKPAGAGP